MGTRGGRSDPDSPVEQADCAGTTSWAAMEFLRAALRKNARRLRLEQWLLLAVRHAGRSADRFRLVRSERFVAAGPGCR